MNMKWMVQPRKQKLQMSLIVSYAKIPILWVNVRILKGLLRMTDGSFAEADTFASSVWGKDIEPQIVRLEFDVLFAEGIITELSIE